MNRAARTLVINEAVRQWLGRKLKCIHVGEIGLETAVSVAERRKQAVPYDSDDDVQIFDVRADFLAWIRFQGDEKFIIVEVKSSLSDYRSDEKWQNYWRYCNQFFFAVDEDFPIHEIDISTGAGVLVVNNNGWARIVKRARVRPALGEGVDREQLIFLIARRLYNQDYELRYRLKFGDEAWEWYKRNTR